jgi:hypothetical protein
MKDKLLRLDLAFIPILHNLLKHETLTEAVTNEDYFSLVRECTLMKSRSQNPISVSSV